MAAVETRVEDAPDRVRVYNAGPHKHIPALLERLIRVYTGDVFVDDWTTWFSPVHTIYDQYWTDPATGERRPEQLRVAVFYNPISDGETELFVLSWSLTSLWSRMGTGHLLRPLVRRLIAYEIERDRQLLETLADKTPDIRGMRLGRFDRVLGAHRRRIDRLYRARDA